MKEKTPRKPKFRRGVEYHIKYSSAKAPAEASVEELYRGVSLALREGIIDRLIKTETRYLRKDPKRLYYLSMEFLMGRSLGNTLHNLGIYDEVKDSLVDMGIDLEEVRENEVDAALGNGGLGRLAACFMDSLATQGIPGFGYGINYEFGLFKQEIENGYQKEKPDYWCGQETPWLIPRHSESCIVPVYGRIEHAQDRSGNYNPMWMDWTILIGIPYDMPVVGFGGKTVNYLRLFSARSSHEFDMEIFNEGDYFKAVDQKIASETVSKVLYPQDSFEAGRELRLIQEYFLVACTIRDITRRYLANHEDIAGFSSQVAIQLNDTHPAIAVAELMRFLVDEQGVDWEKAWEISQAILGYTNHTLMSEALEKWPVWMFEKVLPRHLMIIYEINHRFLQEVSARWPGDTERLRRMSIIEECEPKQVRMAHLAVIGSHSVNGVARLHTELVKRSLFPDFHEMWPERFNNKTNGITQRRWLLNANPLLAGLISESIGDAWITDLSRLKELEKFVSEKAFARRFLKIKKANKERLARIILDGCGVKVDPETLFDIQIKRIHEYKRQLLNVLYIIHQYLSIIEGQKKLTVPKTYVFSGKAAPGYFAAKQIIKLINNVAKVVNYDPRVKDQLKVVFIPDYRVSVAEKIIPAADISQQISTAGMEASGTGNMKLALNGALTVGTLDGANIEIMEEVGKENIYIFGHTSEQIQRMREFNTYNPWDYYHQDERIRQVVDCISKDLFSPKEPGIFSSIIEKLLHEGDYYFHLADFSSYAETQERASEDYSNPILWAKKSILNVARMGKFSSDRTISEYAKGIWSVSPVL